MGQIRLGGGGAFIDQCLHSDPTQGADPASGVERTSLSKKFILLHMEKFHTMRRQTQLSIYTHTKKSGVMQTQHVGSNPTNLEEQKGGSGQTPQVGQVICVYTEGQKAGLTPHLGFDPTIGSTV